jgi:hypothetical protein
MTNRETDLDDLLEKLTQGRDELNLKIHLGKAEAKDLWHQTEDKWRHLRSQLDMIDDDTGDVAKDVGAAAILLAEEIKQGYEQLKKML